MTLSAGPAVPWPRCYGRPLAQAYIRLVAEMSHGDSKHSGYGKDLSLYGFEDYTCIKHVMSNIEG